MEILIGIIFIALVITVVVVNHNSSRPPQTLSRDTSSILEKKPAASPPPCTTAPVPEPAPETFDRDSGRQLPQTRTLSGPAWITDGDTITIDKTQVRLFGVDAPELDHPYGKKAKWALHALCKGQEIRAEITDEDDYGRTVAKCFLPDGRDLSAEMVKLGMAIDWPKFSEGKYADLEVEGVRKRLFLADARQKGRMHLWKSYEARKKGSAG